MTTKTCSIEGCTKKHCARGFCELHYDRWLRTGTTDLKIKLEKTCSVEGCTEKYNAKGYCKKHYEKLKISDKSCSVEGCNRKYKAKGFCASHYQKAELSEKSCTIEDCKRSHCARGLALEFHKKTTKRIKRNALQGEEGQRRMMLRDEIRKLKVQTYDHLADEMVTKLHHPLNPA